MDAVAALADLIRPGQERLTGTALVVVETSPELRGRYSSEEIGQLVNGFRALMLEALEGEGEETRALFLETAVPALVADGQSPASIIRGAVAFGVAISCELLQQVGERQRADAAAWLAGFFGDYCHDVVAAAEAAG